MTSDKNTLKPSVVSAILKKITSLSQDVSPSNFFG